MRHLWVFIPSRIRFGLSTASSLFADSRDLTSVKVVLWTQNFCENFTTGPLHCYLKYFTIAVTSQHPAYNVTAEAARTTVRVSWLPAYDAGFPLHYVVWYLSYIAFSLVALQKKETEDWINCATD